MAFTDYAKKRLMETESFDAADKYIALGVGTPNNPTELSGHGYSRGRWRTSNMSAAADGTVSGSQIVVYTANDGLAQQATVSAIYDRATGGNQIVEWESFSNPPEAPLNGQEVLLTPSVTP